jgi:predicted O-methyltransferase YrrM
MRRKTRCSPRCGKNRGVPRSLVDELRAQPPGLHGGGAEYWGLAWEALEWLEREVRPGMATLETGSGASTLVFAAGGTEHEAVTPAADEEERFRAECERRAIDGSRVAFRIGLSHEVLPALDARPLDLVLVDGAHGFPYPILDWWFLAGRVRLGGRMLLDDADMPPVRALVDALRAQPGWELEQPASFRTAVVRKVADGLPSFDWEGERIGGGMSFGYLPPGARVVAAARQRVFSTRLGLKAVELARRRTGLRFRRRG